MEPLRQTWSLVTKRTFFLYQEGSRKKVKSERRKADGVSGNFLKYTQLPWDEFNFFSLYHQISSSLLPYPYSENTQTYPNRIFLQN